MHMPDHDGVFARHGLPWRLRVTGTLMSVVDCNGNIVVSDDHAGAEAVGELIIDAVNAYPDIAAGAPLWDEPGV
jgi:hypothetical protein